MSAVAGKKIVYLFRAHSAAATTDGAKLAYVTENGRTKSKDADSTATKDGSIRAPGAMEQEITATTLLKKTDTMIESMESWIDNDTLLDIWEANLEEAGATAGKYKGRYFQGYLTELEKTSNAEDMVEISMTFGINGTGATGDVTVSSSQQEEAEYAFTDSPKGSTGQSGSSGQSA